MFLNKAIRSQVLNSLQVDEDGDADALSDDPCAEQSGPCFDFRAHGTRVVLCWRLKHNDSG